MQDNNLFHTSGQRDMYYYFSLSQYGPQSIDERRSSKRAPTIPVLDISCIKYIIFESIASALL